MRALGHSLLMLFIAAVLLSADGIAQKKATKKEFDQAYAEFQKFYSNSNKHMRKAAVDDFGNCNHPGTIKPLLKCLKDKEQEVRNRVRPALERQTTKEATAILTRELAKNGALETRLIILNAFKKSRPKVAFKTVLNLAKGKIFELRLVAAELLGHLPEDPDAIGKVMIDLTKDKDPQMRLVAIDTLIAIKDKRAFDRCMELMKSDRDWRVKATAIKSMVMFRKKSSVVPLIDILESGEGRLREDAHRALIELTGRQYSNNPVRWRNWWKRSKGHFKMPTDEEIAKQRAKLKEAMRAYEGDGDPPPFLGIKTKSKRMLFILDVSGSMQDRVIKATTPEKKIKEFQELYGEGETKIDLCRNQLINTVAGLEKHVKFNIVLFDAEVNPWKKKLVSATGGNKNQALKFLSKLTPKMIENRVAKEDKGGTNTFEALNFAFGLTKGPKEKPTKNHTVENDTVFFLTDGLPTAGRMTDVTEILRYVNVVNRRAKIVFHTLTFGTGNEGFLRPIAENSGGRYVAVPLQ